ncbi:MAG: hypothetical protein GXX85_04100 [Ignavibacteria bacterium]|nr:hypothetical protein [Ignavibacteria bacterium]
MKERILNIYLVIVNDIVTEFRAKDYLLDGDDDSKIKFLYSKAAADFDDAVKYEAPSNKNDKKMTYKQFSKLEKQGRHYELFENIFTKYEIPENPLICVTPVVDGKIICQ